MAFKKPKKAPQFADLKRILSETQLDNATYQVIETLIDRLTQFQSVVMTEIEGIIENAKKNQGNNGNNEPQLPAPHASTHVPGGTDEIANVAWENQPNVFTQKQNLQAGSLIQSYLEWPVLAYAPPTLVTRSLGTRIILYPLVGPSTVDYAIGMDGGVLWQSVPALNNGAFKWYGGTSVQMELNNNNLNVVNTISAGNNIKAGGNFLHRDGSIGMTLGSTISMFTDDYDHLSKDGNIYLMRLSYPGDLTIGRDATVNRNLIVNSAITANGVIQGAQFKSNASVNDPAIFNGTTYARVHWRDMSAAPGNQTWVIINYAGYLRILPTSDDGGTPYNGDWGRSLYIGRSGDVNIGPGGIIVNRVINGAGLAHGQYIPGKSVLTNVSALTAYEANYLRVGNTVTVSGQANVTIINPGLYQFLLTVPFANVQYGAGIFQPANSGIQAGYVSHNSSYPTFIMFSSYISSGGSQVVFYTYTYNVV